MNEIKFSYATIEYKEPIMYIRFKDGVLLGPKEILEIGEAQEKLSVNRPRLILTDARVPVDITEAGREISADPRKHGNVIAHALVVKWLAQRLIANVYKNINKPPYPMRVFDDEKEAVKWLLEQKSKMK
jgi:hypothetical protein